MSKYCGRKRKYLKGDAKRYAEIRSAFKHRPPGSIYHCEKCGFWHITKMSPSEQIDRIIKLS